jgi:hypothetical protein
MDLYSFLLFVGPLIASPAALGVAWYLWLRTPEDFEIAQWRRVLVVSGATLRVRERRAVLRLRNPPKYLSRALRAWNGRCLVDSRFRSGSSRHIRLGLRPRPRRPFDLSRRTLGIRSLGADRNYDFLIVSIRNWRFAP